MRDADILRHPIKVLPCPVRIHCVRCFVRRAYDVDVCWHFVDRRGPGGRVTVESAGAGRTFTLAHLLSNRVVTGL